MPALTRRNYIGSRYDVSGNRAVEAETAARRIVREVHVHIGVMLFRGPRSRGPVRGVRAEPNDREEESCNHPAGRS